MTFAYQIGISSSITSLRISWALRPLMELLGKRDCYQEALQYYAKLCTLLDEDGQQPDPHTQDVVAYLRAKQVQRTSHNPQMHSTVTGTTSPATIRVPDLVISSTSPEQNIVVPTPNTFVHLLPFEMASIDGATWLGVRLAHILSFIHQWSKQITPCDILQAILDREIAMFDDLRGTSSEEAFLLSRRQALITSLLCSLLCSRSSHSLCLPKNFSRNALQVLPLAGISCVEENFC